MHTGYRWSLFAALLAAVVLVGVAPPAQAQFGVAGGLNFESAGDIQAQDTEATLDNSTGYHVGLVYEFDVGPLHFRPGFFYRRVGSFRLESVSNQLEDATFTVTAWEVPVDLRLEALSSAFISPYVVGGPKATIPRGEGDFDDALEDISYVFNVGVGADVSVPVTSLRLQPELRYEFGATGFINEDDDVSIGGATFTPRESPRFSTVSLRLNVLF